MSQLSQNNARSGPSRSASAFSFRHSSRTHPDPSSSPQEQELKHSAPKSLLRRLVRMFGLSDFKNPEVWRGAVVEVAGMSAYEFTLILTILACSEAGFKHPRLATAVAQFLVWAFCIMGASFSTQQQQQHLNPSFTFTSLLTGHISPVRAILYMGGQLAGSVFGAFGAKQLVLKETAKKYVLGACILHRQGSSRAGFEEKPGVILEFGLSFVLILVAFPMGLDYYMNPLLSSQGGLVLGPLIVGGVLGLLGFISSELRPIESGYTGAGMNPARCFGPAVLENVWTSHWVFWAGPLAAAAAFALVYHAVGFRGRPVEFAEEAGEFLTPPQEQPAAAACQDRRADVFLHIKAIMHRSESNISRSRSSMGNNSNRMIPQLDSAPLMREQSIDVSLDS